MAEEKSNVLVFYVNGKKVIDDKVDPEWTLLYYLRNKLRLCGTKLGCGEGGCGACTVMVSKYDRTNNKINHIPVNACLAPVCSMHGLAVTTVEGIGSTKTKLHPVQERIAKSHGSQCGFCTPGIVMSMYTLLRNAPKPSMKQMEVAFQGNLCRCTGYRPIIEGYKTFTQGSVTNGCAMGDKCCKLNPEEVLFNPGEFTPFDPSQEPIFPPELKLSPVYDCQYLEIKGAAVTWFRPTKLEELLALKKRHPEAKLVVGNTEVGVEVKFKNMVYPVIIAPAQIPEMVEVKKISTGLRVGAATSLVDLEELLKREIASLPEDKTRVFAAIVDMLHWFAGRQIRSVAAIGGNIMTGSPISDLIPILMCNEVLLELQSQDGGVREVKLDEHFFTGYRRSVVKPEEILLAIHIPYTHKDRYCVAYKQAKRREDDIAIVNAAVSVTFEPDTDVIADVNAAFGGMSFKTVTAVKTRSRLRGLPWNRNMLDVAFASLQEDLPLDPGAPGGMILYRKSLTLSLFFKAYLAIGVKLAEYVPRVKIDKRELSGKDGFQAKEYKSSQYFNVVPETQEKNDAVQRPLVHRSAYKQATGEAVYCDDIPFFENELYMALVTSTKAHAKILSVDASEALLMDGVHYFVSARDVEPGRNRFGSIVHDEKVFYDDVVTSQGQIIGGVVAVDQITAQKAAKKVRVQYEEIKPIIVTIQDAIKYNSFFGNPHRVIEKGDVDSVLDEAPHVVESECQMGGQEHFYLETQCVVAVPKHEDDEIDIYSSTQNPSEVATALAEVLGIQQNKICAKVKRLGGGFGGKESKGMILAVPAAVAAVKLGRPVRCMLDRDEDMAITGGRHPFLMRYKLGFDDRGRILAVDIKIYSNCGYSIDLSPSVLERAMTHFENAYKIPSVRVVGYMCKTNLPSNTAFRGFGGPQGMFAAECMIQEIADYLDKDPVELSELNLYKEGDVTHYNQKLVDCTIDKCWKECIQSSNYYEKRKSVDRFNRENRYKKRGLSVIPTKYGIAFTAPHLNQAGALVLVYTDGSVLLSHGGIEMGQGLYTKMLQVASRSLEVPIEKIHTVETATDKVPNTSPTAASSGSDLNGMAVMQACSIIKERLKPYKEADPKGKWEDWVKKAYLDRVCLSATGFYKTPNIGYNWETGEGNMFNYFTYGVACCEVEIDSLTGDHQVHSVDIVMDLVRRTKLTFRLDKCEFGKRAVDFLGLRLTGEGLQPGPRKLLAIEEFPVPANKHELRRFLGLSGFFRRFVSNYAAIARPLSDLTKGDKVFKWGQREDDAFRRLKSLLQEPPVLKVFDPQSRTTELHCDASKLGVAGMLLQEGSDEKLHLVYCVSKKTSPTEMNYHSSKLELLAIVWCIERLRPMLLGIKFVVVSDCQALVYLNAKKTLNPQIARWYSTLSEYNFEIRHRKGEKMAHVDCLSRAATEEASNEMIEEIYEKRLPMFIIISEEERIMMIQRSDKRLNELINILQKNPEDRTREEKNLVDDYKLENGRLFRKVKVNKKEEWLYVIPDSMRKSLAVKYHDLRGHWSLDRTVGAILCKFWFRGLRRYIRQHIRGCFECLLTKIPGGKKPGYLHPRKLPTRPMLRLHVDHLGPFKKSRRNHQHLLVVVDAFSRYIKLYATKSTSSEETVQRIEDFIYQFGAPEEIITDRGTAYTGSQFQNLCRKYSIEHKPIASHYPQANGMAERQMRAIVPTIVTAINFEDENWDRNLIRIERDLNVPANKTTGRSPFECVFGYQPTFEDSSMIRVTECEDQTNQSREDIWEDVRERVNQKQRVYKDWYDRKRFKGWKYQVGDIVAMKKNAVAMGGEPTKTQLKYRGPLVVIEDVGGDTYRVEDLCKNSGRIYTTTAHASQLKIYQNAADEEGEQNEECDDADESFEDVHHVSRDESKADETDVSDADPDDVWEPEESIPNHNVPDERREMKRARRPPAYLQEYETDSRLNLGTN